MYHREYPISPSQEAVNGALEIYVEGGKLENVRQMLFGLSVLRSATEEQLHLAMPLVQARHDISDAGIQGVLAI